MVRVIPSWKATLPVCWPAVRATCVPEALERGAVIGDDRAVPAWCRHGPPPSTAEVKTRAHVLSMAWLPTTYGQCPRLPSPPVTTHESGRGMEMLTEHIGKRVRWPWPLLC